jgi:Ca-activated chloride channel homolog
LARQSPLGNEDDVAVELVIAEEPPITNLASLPQPETSYDGQAGGVEPSSARTVLGGTSFSNSTQIRPGTWTDSIATGETVFYRVRLETGQRVRVTATTPAPRSSWRLGPADALTSRLVLFSPARSTLTVRQAPLQGKGAVTITAASPQVRVRNREVPPPPSYLDPSVTTASISGDYDVALQLDPLQKFLTGRVMQVRLSLAVDGKASGQPVYATTATSATPTASAPPSAVPTTSASPAPDPEPRLPVWVGVLGGGVLASALVVGAVLWNRRRARSAVRHPRNR